MASAAGIIIATGTMTLANEFIQSKQTPDPAHPVASVVNWKVIPATAIAAGLFYGFEKANAQIATGVAVIAFITAFAFIPPPRGGTTPLGTLMSMAGIHLPLGQDLTGASPGTGLISSGLPYGVD